VLSAAGLLTAPLAFDFVRTRRGLVDELDWAAVEDLYAEMEFAGAELLAAGGVAPEDVRHVRSADLRYAGQGHELRVELPQGGGREELAGAFARAYRELYGHRGPRVALEALSWRVVSSGPTPQPALRPPPAEGAARAAGERQAVFAGRRRRVPVHQRGALEPGARIAGPAIVEERESTLVLDEGAQAVVDEQAALVVRFR
jgi:N-methylhydantoinase A